MRGVLTLISIAMWLAACGSTTVVDSGPDEDIATDVATDIATDTAQTDSETTDVGDPDAAQDSETAAEDSGTTACDTVGCACDAAAGCDGDLVCANGQCCAPSCEGKVCGDDGCGGTCGECDGEFGCNQYGACMICEPGVSVCMGNMTSTCNAGGDGYAGVPFDCTNLPETPVCQDGACVCAPDCEGKVCGDDGCGGSCGVCEDITTTCSQGQCVCAPQCEGVECGDDGCGGSCGECASGVCNNGVCESPEYTLGDHCQNPFVIESLPYAVAEASTVKASGNQHLACIAVGGGDGIVDGAGRDHVYAVTVEAAGSLDVGFSTWSMEQVPHWPMIVYMQKSCEQMCSDFVMATENVSMIATMPVDKGDTVYIFVDGLDWGDEGTYTLNVQLK